MKDQHAQHTPQDALARWNRLPSEEGRAVIVRGANRRPLALRRTGGVWRVLDRSEVGEGAIEVDLPTKALLPAFANAHTHLDLTHVGPREYDPSNPRGFVAWIDMVRSARATDPQAIRASVREGVEKSLAGGVAAVGDIAGATRTEPVEELRASPLAGVSFVEFFGLGERQRATIGTMRAVVEREPVFADGVQLGVQPHALYSAGPDVFRAAQELRRTHRVALSTHLSESAEEWAIIMTGQGPMADFLRSMGIEWCEPKNKTPVNRFNALEGEEPWLLAHVNALDDIDLLLFPPSCHAVAYCPRGFGYFRHDLSIGRHRWREMRLAGVRVCLATDSIINLPPEQADRISPLDDARRVFRAERTFSPTDDESLAALLLSMITIEGARALGLQADLFTPRPGPIMGLVAVEVGEGPVQRHMPLVAALESDAAPELLALSDKRELASSGLLWGRA